MSGINFMVDEKGHKTAVVINLKEHAQIWEDIYDTFLARARRNEPRESFQSVKRRLKAK